MLNIGLSDHQFMIQVIRMNGNTLKTTTNYNPLQDIKYLLDQIIPVTLYIRLRNTENTTEYVDIEK